MKVTSLELENFRNIASARLIPCGGVNVIFGENAQGKTNLLESLWLCSGGKSFRGAREGQMVRFGEKLFRIGLTFEDRQREQRLIYQSSGGSRKLLLNGVPLKSGSELSGEFLSVVFSPADLSIVQEGPAARRAFLDNAISQIKPVYAKYLLQYNSVLEQRGALLREISLRGNRAADTLDIWDQQLARMGTAISIFRQDYLRKLSEVSEKVYGGFSGFQEHFSLQYESSVFGPEDALEIYSDELIEKYRNALRESLENDVRMRSTGKGIHRDDMDMRVNGLSARSYGSQGQQRSCAIALKIGEAMLLKGVTGEDPVILLDDVMSELDQGRQDYLLNRIKNFQVFITCCDIAGALRMEQGRVFHVEKGIVEEIPLERIRSGSL
ncbi:MAG: DNA replication/repair protein RecF [Oscillospiraceae bacterium]|nr:DNA replication/repair protein RecF [Oscillospiraceae bacterium]